MFEIRGVGSGHGTWDAAGPHAKLVARNRAVLASLQATCSTRAFRTVPLQELTDAAHKAARLI